METGERKNIQLSAGETTPTATMSPDRTIFPDEGDCMAPTPAGSTNICKGGAVAYAFSIRVTAQAPLTTLGGCSRGYRGCSGDQGES
jgi:hypothetical protein